MECGCAAGKLQVVHDYLKDCFPGQALRDVHTRSTAVPSRALGPAADYHIVRIGDAMHPYAAVLTSQFLQHPIEELQDRLHRIHLLTALQSHRVVIVWGDGVYPLRPSGPEHG